MKKIVFCSVCLQIDFKAVYSAKQKDIYEGSTYDEPIYYPINAMLANTLQKDDDVKLVFFKTVDDTVKDWDERYQRNYNYFIEELKKINEGIGAKINLDDPVVIESDFKETKDVFKKRFMDAFEVLEEDAEIYADVTFGSRVVPMIIMDVLKFAEKFFNADINHVLYGQTSYEKNPETKKNEPKSGIVYDISSLYYINNLTNILKADSGKEAIQAFKEFLIDED